MPDVARKARAHRAVLVIADFQLPSAHAGDGKISSLGGALPPQYRGAAAGLAAVLGLSSYLTADNGTMPLKSIDLAARRWFAEQLVPSAFPWLLRGTPPPLGPPVARALTCRGVGSGGYGQPWSAYPNVAEFRTPTNWYPDHSPIEPTFFFSRAGLNTESISPSPALANLLFNPVNPATGSLGLSKLDFLSPRVFPIVANANDRAAQCGDLPA